MPLSGGLVVDVLDSLITWSDLIKIVLFLLGAGVLFYLLLAIANLVRILGNLNSIISKNKDNINLTLEKVPEITENVSKVSGIVKDEMENIQKVMGNITKATDSVKDTVEIVKKDIILKAKNILDLIDWIKNLFEKSKKKEIVYKYKYKQDKVQEEVIENEEPCENEEEEIKESNEA